MPKELFSTIPQAKRDKILSAAFAEFSAQKYYQASINKIIKEADISRGSFYQYFEDKEDIYFYLLEHIVRSRLPLFVSEQPPSPDFIDYHQDIFRFNLSLLSNPTYQAFFENLYLSMDYYLTQRVIKVLDRIRKELLYEIAVPATWDGRKTEAILNIFTLISRDLLIVKAQNKVSDQQLLEEHRYWLELLKLKP